MPRRKQAQNACSHRQLFPDSSPCAAEVGYKRPSPSQLLAAITPNGRAPKSSKENPNPPSALPPPGTFLAPLVLPGDDLTYDPKYPPQSLHSVTNNKYRNPVTRERSTIYVVSPPAVASEVKVVESWIQPLEGSPSDSTTLPETDDLISFLSDFYYPMAVKRYPKALTFMTWPEEPTPKPKPKSISQSNIANNSPQYIGLATTDSCTRIRCRPCPPSSNSDSTKPLFPTQFNLSDLLDTLINSVLPTTPSSYAVLLLTHHDIYESPEDDFVCGRAYGGSRVAVVSSARYQPHLDKVQGIDVQHSWPASHCAQHIAKMCGVTLKSLKASDVKVPDSSPVSCALRAFTSSFRGSSANKASDLTLYRHPETTLSEKKKERSSAYIRHIYRLSRTAAHELGHCLGLDHCVYYACLMQSTAGLDEDARQPPVFCAVCEAKVGWAVEEHLVKRRGGVGAGWRRKREQRLVGTCEEWVDEAAAASTASAAATKARAPGIRDGDGDGAEGWRAMAAWLRARWEGEDRIRTIEEEGARLPLRGAAVGGEGRKRKRGLGNAETAEQEEGGEKKADGEIEVIDLTS